MKPAYREPVYYTVRFTLPGGKQWHVKVQARSSKEAELLAKIQAGLRNIPVLECKVEVL